MVDLRQLESAIWSIADGRSTDADMELFRADERATLALLDRLIVDTEDDLDAVRDRPADEREYALADLNDTLESLLTTAAILRPPPPRRTAPPVAPNAAAPARVVEPEPPLEPEEVQLQASWAAGKVVVWAGARGATPENYDELSTRLEAIGGPPMGWQVHPSVKLPGDFRADALSIPMKDALGWLVHVNRSDPTGVGPSVLWLARVALEGVRHATTGSIVPTLRLGGQPQTRVADVSVRWKPALVDSPRILGLAAVMPRTVAAINANDGRSTVTAIIGAVVEAIVSEAVERMELPAAPPTVNTLHEVGEAIVARMDGSTFRAPSPIATTAARTVDQWTRTVTSQSRPRLVVQLSPPDSGGVWLVSVRAPGPKGDLVALDAALRAERSGRHVADEWARLDRLFPALGRAGVRRRGQVALSQDEAWAFMTTLGPTLAAAGFEVRGPKLSRRKPAPSLRLFAEATSSVVGAHQLSNVAWSVLFDDVELTSEEVARLAKQARPLVQSQGRWVELDRLDLEQAAAALAERESVTKLTGAEILRHSIGLDGTGLRGGVIVEGESWASEILRSAAEASREPITKPEGFAGELRTYQGEALGWLAFLESAELGGCLALDMGLGKTPTVLAHLARSATDAPALVIAPAAVVGNWAAEAARFTPQLRVVIHHGADRASAEDLATEIKGADVVITTYATAVRDIDALINLEWARIVLDEAQAIKNSTSETAQQLRRINARTRIALTGTPIENGLGDLWSILDFTNPGLVGSRPTFIAQMSGAQSSATAEAALRALNGILLFRRTKSEPEVAAELPDKIDELDHCTMTTEQIGLYQAILDQLLAEVSGAEGEPKQGAILAAITALKQVCNHPAAYRDDGRPLAGRSGKLARLEELVESVFAAGERVLVFTHFASWGRRLATHLTEVTGIPISCYDGSLARGARDRLVAEFQEGKGPGALVLSLKAGGTGLNLTAANHVVLYDRWWNPAVEDQARDRAWRIGQEKMVISHRLVCPGTVDERVEEVVAGKRHIADLVLPKSSSISDLDADQLRIALGLRTDELIAEETP